MGKRLDALKVRTIRGVKLTLLSALLVGCVLLVGAVFALSAPADVPYSNDEFTVANSSDGEQVVITYEVSTTVKENADKQIRKERMDEMQRVSACANARLDAYIQSNSREQVESANLQEVVISCETDDVSVENIRVAGDVV